MKKKRKKTPLPEVAKSINYPLIGLVTLLVARPLVPEDPGGQTGYGVAFILLWLLLATGWIVQQLQSRRMPARIDLADLLMLALVGWHSAAAVGAAIARSPRPAVNMLWEWISLGLVFLLTRRIVTTGAEARGVIATMTGLAVGLSLVAIEQRFVSIPNDQRAFEQVREDPAELYALTGHWLPPGSPELNRFESRLKSQQPSATFALANSLAGFLVPWSLLLACLMLDGPLRPTSGWPRFAVAGFSLGAMWLTLVFTGSRSATLATFAGLMAIAALSALKLPYRQFLFKVVAILLAFVGVAALLAVNGGWGRNALEGAQRSVAFRIEYWRATLAMIADHPLFGSGPGQFQDIYTRYKLPMASEEIQDPHNWLLEVTATAGIPAGVLLLALLVTIGWRIARQQRLATASGNPRGICPEVLSGAACGLVLGLVLAFTNGFAPSVRQMALIAMGQAAMWWLLRPWIIRGTLASYVVLIAVAALLLNLSAAGGIGYPCVADSLWLLAAVGLGAVTMQSSEAAPVTRSAGRAVWLTLLAICAVLFIAAYATAYRPVTTSRAWLARADSAFLSRQTAEQGTAVESAALADEWSSQAALQLAAARLAAYELQPNAERLAAVEGAVDRVLRLAPQKSAAWLRASEISESIYRKTSAAEQLHSAIDYQRQAIERYPTNPRYHAHLAKLLVESGQKSPAVRSAQESLRLDDLLRKAGHADRELTPAERNELRQIAGETAAFDGEKTSPVQ